MVLIMVNSNEKKIEKIVEGVVYNRPLPYRAYDQIYMCTQDLVSFIYKLSNYVINKNLVFMGDGDGVSASVAQLVNGDSMPLARSIRVFDFDERILHAYENVVNMNNLGIHFECVRYNIIDPLPKYYSNTSNFFIINPPYGSKNEGRSCIAWLHRCFEVCGTNNFNDCPPCSGCIVLPYDYTQKWTQSNMLNIQTFLLKNGFVIREMLPYQHRYDLPDNPTLTSAFIIVDQIKKNKLCYVNTLLPKELIKNLYGQERPIPHHIRDNNTPYGNLDMNWQYGREGFWVE